MKNIFSNCISSSKVALLLSVMAFAQCRPVYYEDIVGWQDDDKDEGYTSYWYWSYEATLLIDAASVGMETSEDFNPYTVAHIGDTLFIANTGKAGNGIVLFSQKKGETIGHVRSWQVNGEEKSFTSNIESIIPHGDRLYVTERQSYIHVFRLPDLAYITCIGNGNFNGPIFQAQAAAIGEGLIFARDKTGQVSVYKESDVTPENYQKVNRYKRASGNGSPGNNGFNPHYMQFDDSGHIMLTDYEGQKIRVLDPSLVNDSFENGNAIDLDDLSMPLDFKPKTFALCKDRMYITGNNNLINIYDTETKGIVKQLKSVKGYTFSMPARVYVQNDTTLWISDMHDSKRTLVKVLAHKGEIRE